MNPGAAAALQAYVPPFIEHGGRAWGFGLNLYALRSKHNWGIGDFSDLREFAILSARLGASMLGVNPLHALHWALPEAASPYSPANRFFLNPLYIDVAALPEFDLAGAGGEFLAGTDVLDDLVAARAAEHVDYARVGKLKRRALNLAYTTFRRRRESKRMLAFERFVERGGERLRRFARYETLNEQFAREGRFGWLNWPASEAKPRDLERESESRDEFFMYVQFVAREQRAEAAAVAHGLGLGLYGDLAVGVDPNSNEVWGDRERFVMGESVGAPPDPLGPLGQDWGLAPLDAGALERDGAEFFADLLRANMAQTGALRIDHVMALQRLFRIPHGSPPSAGAYVEYPFALLLSVVARESARARCLVVGEDLGTVPEGFRERMAAARILSYRLLMFERDAGGGFLPPEAYPRWALATATTHDLPTLAGWALGRDLDTRARLGLMEGTAHEGARGLRRLEVSRLLDALAAAGTLDAAGLDYLHATIDARSTEGDAYFPLTAAAYGFLARTPARLLLVQLDDALGELDQINLPGTALEYPNWRRKNRRSLEELAHDERLEALARSISAEVRKEADR